MAESVQGHAGDCVGGNWVELHDALPEGQGKAHPHGRHSSAGEGHTLLS